MRESLRHNRWFALWFHGALFWLFAPFSFVVWHLAMHSGTREFLPLSPLEVWIAIAIYVIPVVAVHPWPLTLAWLRRTWASRRAT